MSTDRGTPALTMHFALRSELGHRANNEDALFATPRLVAVADGVGGATAGEVASQIVIQEMASLDKRRLTETLADELRSSITAANENLRFTVSCRPHLEGMASTLTVVALSNDGCYLVANIGDSRAYLYRNDTLHQLTRDESLVQMLVDDGAITPEEARTHPQRSVVLHALDGAHHHDFEVSTHEAMAGDRLLLCSDGLSDVVPDAAIAEILAISPCDAAAEELLGAALSAGAADNVSFVVADVTPATDESVGWLETLTANGSDSRATDAPPPPG